VDEKWAFPPFRIHCQPCDRKAGNNGGSESLQPAKFEAKCSNCTNKFPSQLDPRGTPEGTDRGGWVRWIDPASNEPYYENATTGEVSWDAQGPWAMDQTISQGTYLSTRDGIGAPLKPGDAMPEFVSDYKGNPCPSCNRTDAKANIYWECTTCNQGEIYGLNVYLNEIRSVLATDTGGCLACGITYDELQTSPNDNIVRYRDCESCFYCVSCFKNVTEAALENGRSMLRESSQRYWLLPCPKHPNSFHSTPQTFKIASNKAYTLIKKYGAFRHVLDNGGYLCPLAGCKSNSPFTPANPNEARVDCPTCHRGFCKFCMEGWGMHKETCQLYDEYVLPPPADPRDMLLRTLVEGCSMRCPGLCNRLLQKGEGSIHIRNCGDPECGTDFCYGCGRLSGDCNPDPLHTTGVGRPGGCPGGEAFLHLLPEWQTEIQDICDASQIPPWAAANRIFHRNKTRCELARLREEIGHTAWNRLRQTEPTLLNGVLTMGGGTPTDINWDDVQECGHFDAVNH